MYVRLTRIFCAYGSLITQKTKFNSPLLRHSNVSVIWRLDPGTRQQRCSATQPQMPRSTRSLLPCTKIPLVARSSILVSAIGSKRRDLRLWRINSFGQKNLKTGRKRRRFSFPLPLKSSYPATTEFGSLSQGSSFIPLLTAISSGEVLRMWSKLCPEFRRLKFLRESQKSTYLNLRTSLPWRQWWSIPSNTKTKYTP